MRPNFTFRPPPQYIAPQLYRRPPKIFIVPALLYDPLTEQQVTIGTLDAGSILQGQTPAVTTGDQWILPLYTTPGHYAVTGYDDGTFSYAALGDTTRQSISTKVYDTSLAAWFVTDEPGDYFTVYVNNIAPMEVAFIADRQWYTQVAIDPIILGDYVIDADDAESDLTYTGLSITDLSVATATYNPGTPGARTVKQIEGTPSSVSSGTASLTATDVPGASLALTAFNWAIGAGVQVPVGLAGDDFNAAANELAALGLFASVAPVASAIYSYGQVVSITPDYPNYVIPGATIGLTAAAVNMPNVVGMTEAAATALLESLGLTVSIDTGSAGNSVSSQDVEAGTLLLPGQIVTLTLESVTSGVTARRRHHTRSLVVFPFPQTQPDQTPAERAEEMRLTDLRNELQGVFTGNRDGLQRMVDGYKAEQERLQNRSDSEKQFDSLFGGTLQ